MSKNRNRNAEVASSNESDTISSTEIEALKAQAAAELEAANQPSTETETEVATPVATAQRYVMPVNPNSIRQTIRTMLQAGASTKEIAAVLAEKFPTSAAAAKSVKHIAYYRAELKKEAARA